MEVKIQKTLGDISHNTENNTTKEANFSMHRQQHNIATFILNSIKQGITVELNTSNKLS